MVNSIECKAPSNIALIKYWGKRPNQLPQNPSISFTLSRCASNTKVTWTKGSGETLFLFEGQKQESFEKKIKNYRKIWEEEFSFFKELNIEIESSNSFPHSSGIASSASSMASLSLCFSQIAAQNGLFEDDRQKFFNKASAYARLGSGSACRSLFGGVVTWGKWREGTSDEYASPVIDLPDSWNRWGDAILIVSSQAKPVSSRQGHALMENHPYSKVRYEVAKKRVEDLHNIMLNEDLFSFCELVEKEALELHGLMMNSTPSFILMKPESLAIIERVRDFRENEKIPVCFTLDAGPNVHLLYPIGHREKVFEFINAELKSFLENGVVIDDLVGSGPEMQNGL